MSRYKSKGTISMQAPSFDKFCLDTKTDSKPGTLRAWRQGTSTACEWGRLVFLVGALKGGQSSLESELPTGHRFIALYVTRELVWSHYLSKP